MGSVAVNYNTNARRPRRLLDKYSFRITSDVLLSDVGFTTGSELKVSSEVISYRAGGSLIPVKSPGLASYEPFTVTRGATLNIHDLRQWKNRVVRGQQEGKPISVQGAPMGVGESDAAKFKNTLFLVHTNRAHERIMSWAMENAWPSEFTAMDGVDNNASEHIFESMTWEYDFFEYRKGADASIERNSISVNGESVGAFAGGVLGDVASTALSFFSGILD